MNFAIGSSKSMSAVARIVLGITGLSGLILCATARKLEPDPRGFGTHEQLGLTPCNFYQWTGRVCPSCGATTAWAYVMRGNLAEAITANLAGTLSCLAMVVLVPWMLLSACLGRWLGWSPGVRDVLILGSGLLFIALLDWLRRCLT
ncbi:DUF2752 domain-containing protein [Bythopirellula polymerisocia]|uniref:DUF2752 domain-containing protein n=1 Tax=Bythopirellula polymerisocia TaxID=2528003 RepID=A0A5C6CL09_9BACT|nr:DUF2752 domain-containing protein [Bythopirellula polymerisocia]TWU23816.1 hypothetical protein Pla144_39920 [Bythopirellula polymerisocia]